MTLAQLKAQLIEINQAIQLDCNGLDQEQIEANYAFKILAECQSSLLESIKELTVNA